MKNLNRIALVLALILVLAAVLFVYGGNSSNTTPSTVNTRGLGIAAYAELLRREGLPVEIDRSAVLNLKPNDVLVAVYDSFQHDEKYQQFEEIAGPDEDFTPEPTKIEQSITRHLKAGGRVLWLVMPSSSADIRPEGDSHIWETSDKSQKFTIQCTGHTYEDSAPDQGDYVPLITESDNPTIYLYEEDGGISLEVGDATFLRNRFISQADNAELGIWLARRFLPPNGKLVFAEAAVGNEESRTALDELGRWATTAFWQFLLLGAVIVYTLNRRFGVASREITKPRGAKELMGAMSLTLQRAKRRDHALLILRSAAIDRVRKTLRLSAGLSENDIIARMHPDTQALMSQIVRMQGHEIDYKTAISAALSLEASLREMEQEQKASRAPQ